MLIYRKIIREVRDEEVRPFGWYNWRRLYNLTTISCFQGVVRMEHAAFIMQEDALKKPAGPCRQAALTRWRRLMFHARSSIRTLLTNPTPESFPDSVVWALLLGSESVFSTLPPTGQSILATILLVSGLLWADRDKFRVLRNRGVTVMLGSTPWSRPTLSSAKSEALNVDLGDPRASPGVNFGTWAVPDEGFCRGPEDETWSGPENLLIRSLTLLARCKLDFWDRPVAGFLWLALKACTVSSLLVVWWGLSGECGEEDPGACWKEWTQQQRPQHRC